MEQMNLPTDRLASYLHLARASELRRRPMVRDKLLVLAGVAAQRLALDEIANACRAKILRQNPGHLLRRWPSMGEALAQEDFQVYLRRLEQHFSRERTEHMLRSLGIDMARERAVYFSDHEYAAALLNGPASLATSNSTAPSPPTSGDRRADGAKPAGASDLAAAQNLSTRTRHKSGWWIVLLAGLVLLAAWWLLRG